MTENAISSVAKLILAHPTQLDTPQHIARWLSYLPVSADDVEAIVIHKNLCRFIEQYPDAVLGSAPDYERLPYTLSVLGSALETKCVDSDITALFVQVLQHLQQALPGDVLQRVWAELDGEVRDKLQRALAAADDL